MTAYTRGHSLTGVDGLARVTMTLMPPEGDIRSHLQASGAIMPGDVVVAVAADGAEGFQVSGVPQGRVAKVTGSIASAAGGKRRYGVAMRPIEHSSLFSDANSTNTNIAQSNTEIADGEWVRVVHGGVILTTVTASAASAAFESTFAPGTMLTWDGAAAQCAELGGTGGWKATADAAEALAEVVSVKQISTGGLVEFRFLA